MKILRAITRFIDPAARLLIVLCMALISPSGALYSDSETAGNNIGSTSLDLEVSSTTFDVSALSPGDIATKQIIFTNAGNLPFAYSQQYKYASGDQTLCEALKIDVTYNYFNGTTNQEIFKYSGPLKDFAFNLPVDPDDPDALLPNNRIYHSNVQYDENQHWYTYKVSLDANADSSLVNQSCSFDVESYAWQPELEAPLVGFWDFEKTSHTLGSNDWIPESTIKGYKRDESGAGLQGWQIVVHDTRNDPDQTLTIDSTNPDPETSITLEENHIYLIESSGTWTDHNGSETIDTDYFDDDPWNSVDNYDTHNDRDPRQLDLVINDQDVAWGTYQSSHLYKTIYTGEGSTIDLRIFDEDQDSSIDHAWYQDNEGSLTVRIYDVTDEIVVTDDNGYYEKQVKSAQAYQLLEVQQEDWEAVTPRNYFHVNLPVSAEAEYIFVNKKAKYNLVINEVYYDVDTPTKGKETPVNQADEWVELYNPNNFAINLKKWSISDNNTDRTISNRNVYIPAKGFAVIAKAAQTWGYWSIPSDAITIELGQSLGNGLANGGDHLVLKNSNGDEIDKVSWGDDEFAFGTIPTSYQNQLITGDGKSIARSPLGYDTDAHTDWVIVDNPNPGTNPHSHIKVSIAQSPEHELLVKFTNASGFNALKYSISYNHLFEDQQVGEILSGEAIKTNGDQELDLEPIYLGTCSTDGLVCTPHLDITDLKLNLMYKLDTEIIGTSILEYSWQNEETN